MKQNAKNITKHYLIFFLGLLLNSFGVAFVTKGLLGTSPIASIPYSLSLIITQLSLGNWTIIFSILLILIQIILLKKETNKLEIFLYQSSRRYRITENRDVRINSEPSSLFSYKCFYHICIFNYDSSS